MGCGGSTAANGDDDNSSGPPVDTESALKSKQLEAELERQQKEEDAIIKLLVLGTGESGKSTVFKQMKILYSVPDPDEDAGDGKMSKKDKAKFIMICRANLFSNAHAVMEGMTRLSIEFGSEEAKTAAEIIKAVPADGNPENITELVTPLKTMLADKGVIEAIERAAEYQLNDSTIYFWERAEEICTTEYMPTEQDVLRARVRTTGIVQQKFEIKDKKYTMFDVGGQRNERRKWIHCFDNVTAVIFVTAISEYDQVLYEDENTNRMDEALVLFDQICNHPSFKKTSMILFLNKRDLFEMKLKKKDMTCWRDVPELQKAGKDYDMTLTYIKGEFLGKNKAPEERQVYVHATCATDTNNISFVMESVFDIILKDNLRKLAVGDVDAMLELSAGSGTSGVEEGPGIWSENKQGKIILALAYYTDNLKERKVCVSEANAAHLPAVQVSLGLSISENDWEWVMGLGKDLPTMPYFDKEAGSFKGDFKNAAAKLRALAGEEDIGSVYDQPVVMTMASGAKTTLIVCVKKLEGQKAVPGFKYVQHEEFENACYKAFDNKDTDGSPCAPPDKNEEYNPFAANPVGFRWFKGVTLFTKEVLKIPDKGVYLGIFKVLSAAGGFKVMVNEHNRISIPLIFLTESQLSEDDTFWMHGVRTREEKFGIDLLEGKQPNRGWLGPEMTGEEGATFPEKLWWAIDEAKTRLGTEDIGKQYDKELLFIDEGNNIQLLLFGVLAKDSTDLVAGHIWVPKGEFLRQNMKYLCPKVLQGMVKEQQLMVNDVVSRAAEGSVDMATAAKNRAEKDRAKQKLKDALAAQTPLKWVDRVIMWCAEKMPSFTKEGADANACVKDALAQSTEVKKATEAREALIKKYSS